MVWYNKANVYFKKKDYYSALNDYDCAIKIDPNYSDAWLGRGNALTGLKRYDEAFAAYDKALALKPDLAEAWLGRGMSFTISSAMTRPLLLMIKHSDSNLI